MTQKEFEAMLAAVELERICSNCQGSGNDYAYNCCVCDGTGYQLTDLGVKVFNLVRHQFETVTRKEE
jgi:DnaJ-class molecular chaperone